MSWGRNSGVATRSLAFLEELDAREEPVEPAVSVQLRSLLGKRPGILVEWYDMDLEIESACPDELEEPLERRLDPSGLDPRDEGLGYPRSGGKGSLGEPRPAAGFLDELRAVHVSDDTPQASF